MKRTKSSPRNNKNQFLIIGFGFIVIIIVASIYISGQEYDIPFDRFQWQIYEDVQIDGGLRNRMLKDLLESHTLNGLNYHQLTDLLGEPDIKYLGRIDDEKSASYRIKATYDVIDPDYTKDLVFTLNKDSVVDHFIVKEWHRSDQ